MFIAQKIKTAEAIKYTKRKLYLWGKKDVNFVWEPRRTTAQLSVKVTQCHKLKFHLVRKGYMCPVRKWLKEPI